MKIHKNNVTENSNTVFMKLIKYRFESSGINKDYSFNLFMSVSYET